MAETKAERRESWKQRTTATATALRKAKATVYHPSTGRSGRTIPLTAQTPEEIEAIAAGAAKDISVKPTALIDKLYAGPGTGPGISVSPIITHAQRVTDQESAQRIEAIQQQQFEERLRSPIPTHGTGIGAPLHKVAEPVVKEYEAGISTKPTTTDQPPEYVPTPYQPGTLPGEVEYGKRPKFDQLQIHEIMGAKLRELDTYLGEKRMGVDIAVRPHIPDISAEKFTDLVSRGFFLAGAGTPGMSTMALYSGIPPTPGQIAAGEFLHEQYTGFQETPVTAVRDIGTEAAMIIGGSYAIAGLTKLGILGARGAARYGAKKVVTKIPDTGVGKVIQKAVMGTEQVIEPAVGLGFAHAAYQDIKTTPKEELPHKLYEYGLGFAGAAKGYRAPERAIDIFRVRGKKEIPIETIVEPQVLSGAEPFPFVKKGETVPELISRFTGPEYKLPTETPGTPQVWHATAKPFPKEVIVEGGTARPSDLPGLYVAPSVSPHFLRTGQIKTKDAPKLSSWEKIFGAPESLTPTLLGVEVPGISRIPSKYRPSLEASKKYVSSREKAEAIITRDVELAQLGRGKVEAEAVVPPASKLIRVGTDYYIRVGDRRVPIDKYIAEMHIKGKKKPSVTGETEPIPRATPDPSYYLPRAKRRSPYYRGDTKPSTSLVDPVSEVTAPISEYAPKTPREYIPVGVSDYTPAPRSDVPFSAQEYIPPTASEYLKQISREYVPPPKESVAPYVPGYDIPPTITKLKPRPDEKTGFVRKDKLMPGYAWQLANPIATLEQLLGVRESPKRKRTKKKSNKRTKNRRSKR